MQDTKPPKAVCPKCKTDDTRKIKRAPGHYCFTCKVALRDPIEKQQSESKDAGY